VLLCKSAHCRSSAIGLPWFAAAFARHLRAGARLCCWNAGMRKLLAIGALLALMPTTLQVLVVRGRAGETCFVMVDANNRAVGVRCTRPSWET
jgi:hypothetical protein